MTEIFKLLTLPNTSKGFTAYRSTVVEYTADDHGSSRSHPHKTPRLDSDSDPGSAYRSRCQVKGKAVERTGPLEIQVLNFTPKSPDIVYDKLFTIVRGCTRHLLTKSSQPALLPETYETIYNACCTLVCVGRQGEALHNMLVMEIDKSIICLLRELESSRGTGDVVDWLGHFVQVCEWFERQVALVQSLLSYLDRAFILKVPNLSQYPVSSLLAFGSYQRRILNDTFIVEQIRSGVLQWLDWERANGAPHPSRGTIHNLVLHLLTHDAYALIFERFILEQTLSFYTVEATTKIEQHKVSAEDFLAHVTARTGEERERAEAVCGGVGGTVRGVVQNVRRGLLDGRLDWVAKEGMSTLGPLMNAQGLDRLSSIYTEFEALASLDILCREFKSYVQTTVANIVNDVEHEDDMLDHLLSFKSFSDRALQTSFVSPPSSTPHPSFAYALTDAFSYGFRARRNKPAELIARHLDKLMRRGQRGMSDAEWEALLESVLALYRHTDDKDVFRTFYTRALARRLLLGKSASDDFEKGVLRILKEKYDPEFGMGDHMFNDLALSREILREFHNRISEMSSAQKLSVMVLQRSVWPFAARKKDVDLLPSMQSDLASYATFYKAKHQGHKLDWDHSLGTATLKATFKAGAKDLTVSLYQAVVLLLFNDETEIGYSAIQEATRMDDGELKRTLQSLACASKKVLKKRPVGKDVNEDDVFYFNAEFTDARAKVHINSIQAKETPEESKRTQSHIDSDRKHYLDAAIVRIMKAKKELTYEALKTETIGAVKSHFVPEVNVIKQRIVHLVDQEYLKRDDDDMNKFTYVA
ncbi:Cullin family-domain-containing protein [Melanogaster broomeanus]|nr:Cullin family-domain-containing protein [Melanogaster broomeanus]